MVHSATKDTGFRRSKYFLQISLAALICFLLFQKDIQLQFNLQGADISNVLNEAALWPQKDLEKSEPASSGVRQLGSNLLEAVRSTKTEKAKENTSLSYESGMISNDYANMTYHPPASKNQKAKKGRAEKIKRQKNYVKRFSHVAQSEMKKFGIPASITLAQGLIESDAGHSRLSKTNNNHFGMKCFSKKCKKGHCSNFTDDSHKDFFRKYETAWESYRAHSHMLNQKRYRPLHKLGKKNYKAWAKGLKKAGYATDKRYAEKLIHIIEELELYEYDQV